MRRNNLHRRSYKPLLKKAGLPDIRLYDVRHTCATLMLCRKIHSKVVQEMLGHFRIDTSLDFYSHVQPDMQREAVDRLDAMLS
jgi:site-specific recombinase XerD